jgi:hypothetical protein
MEPKKNNNEELCVSSSCSNYKGFVINSCQMPDLITEAQCAAMVLKVDNWHILTQTKNIWYLAFGDLFPDISLFQ